MNDCFPSSDCSEQTLILKAYCGRLHQVTLQLEVQFRGFNNDHMADIHVYIQLIPLNVATKSKKDIYMKSS